MKQLFFILFVFVSFSINAQDVCTPVKIQANLIDSIIMMPNVKKINVSSASLSDKFKNYQSTVFSVVENFLVIDKTLYFDLNKVIAFRIMPKALNNGDLVEFYFE